MGLISRVSSRTYRYKTKIIIKWTIPDSEPDGTLLPKPPKISQTPDKSTSFIYVFNSEMVEKLLLQFRASTQNLISKKLSGRANENSLATERLFNIKSMVKFCSSRVTSDNISITF